MSAPALYNFLAASPVAILPTQIGVLLFIFFGSTILVNYRIEKNPKRFIGNFLVMTTLQLLAFLTYELILIFQGETWWVAIHALGNCIILIVLQA